MREGKGSPIGLYIIGIFTLFLAGALLLVILGAQTYRHTAAGQEKNNQTRGLLSYFSAMIRANDAQGSVYLADLEGPEGSQVLVAEDGSGYASRIYCYDGYLVEDYGEAAAGLMPEEAMKIGKTRTFNVTFFEETGSLLIETDEGRIRLRLRSDGGLAVRGGGS